MAGAERRRGAVASRFLAVGTAALMSLALLPLISGAQQSGDQGFVVCDSPPPAPFADRGEVSAVHLEAVDCLWDMKISIGTHGPDGQRYYLPTKDVTRGQLAAFLFRALEWLGREDELPAPRRPRFMDVHDGHVFDDEIHRLAAAGVIAGFPDGSFRSNDPVRRDQTASLFVRTVEFLLGGPGDPEGGPYFSDTDGNTHESNIDLAYELELVLGVSAPADGELGRYAPAELTNRERMATLIVRFLRETVELIGPPDPQPTATLTASPSATPTPTPTPTPTASEPPDVQPLVFEASHSNPVERGTPLRLTVTATDGNGDPVEGLEVRFEVYRADSNQKAEVRGDWALVLWEHGVTDDSGAVQLQYTQHSLSWKLDAVVACVMQPTEGNPEGEEFCATASGQTLTLRDDGRPVGEARVLWNPRKTKQ